MAGPGSPDYGLTFDPVLRDDAIGLLGICFWGGVVEEIGEG